MQTLTRREMMKASAAAFAGITVMVNESSAEYYRNQERNGRVKIPLLHITDLYHPPQDPDDHLDLATVVALDEFDIKGVVLDVTQKFLESAPAGFDIPRDPGFVPVSQLGYLVGRSIPAAIGPTQPLKGPDDAALDRNLREQSGITMILDVLQSSNEPVVISIVGSARALAAAYNRHPEVVRTKTRSILLNAGSTGGTKREWNVNLDLAAYVGLWRSGLPIHWYPCATDQSAFNPDHERGTYWKAAHSDLFLNLPGPLRAWISHSFAGNARGDIIRALSEEGKGSVWENILAGERNLWATASLVMAAGRVLARTTEGWRFVSAISARDLEVWPWRLDPIEANVNDDGQVLWRTTPHASKAKLFGRGTGAGYGVAMAEALNSLLRSIPV